ncbi:MAG: hypothetical protein C4527_18770 [Candidatus Omnitrophota bacterium]|nr:MAG: hypothetical protein C4527_18770 [Candidatus Omnitrophota bacterium]
MIGCATSEKGTTSATAGHPQFKELCAKCHTLDRVDAAHKAMSQEHMKSIVERMAKKPESGINLHDIDDIVKQIY